LDRDKIASVIMTKTIAFFNQTGGGGKTTLCQNIGYQLAESHKKRVLLVDFDPQGSLTDFMRLELQQNSQTIHETFISEELIALHIYLDIHRMSLVPMRIITASEAEQQLIMMNLKEPQLQQLINPLMQDYDYILIDCPASLNILSINALVAADYILVPIQTQFKVIRSVNTLLQTIKSVKTKMNPKLSIAGFCPNLYFCRNKSDRNILEAITRDLGKMGTVYSPIPNAVSISEASQEGVPFAMSKKKHKAIIEIFEEIAIGFEALV
jgi:chromosome partitioning protein